MGFARGSDLGRVVESFRAGIAPHTPQLGRRTAPLEIRVGGSPEDRVKGGFGQALAHQLPEVARRESAYQCDGA